MNWTQFKESAPDLAKLAEERFQRHGLVLIGTLRRNGWPRISPVEPLIVDGRAVPRHDLPLPQSPRPAERPAHHSADHRQQQGRHRGRGQVVRSCRGRAVSRRPGARTLEAVRREMGYELPDGEEFHLFAVDVQSAAYVVIEGGEQRVKVWP